MGGTIEYVKGKGKIKERIEWGIISRVGEVHVLGVEDGFRIYNDTEYTVFCFTAGLLPRKHTYKGKETALITGEKGGQMIVRAFSGGRKHGIING